MLRLLLPLKAVKPRLFNTTILRRRDLRTFVCRWQVLTRSFSSAPSNCATLAQSIKHDGQKDESCVHSFDYLLVLDFEATCDNISRLYPQEIIEFPCLQVSTENFEIVSTFHQYVQPKVHKELTPFCTELTGIVQDMVQNEPHLEEVLKSFHEWMQKQQLVDGKCKSTFVTCGDWDLKEMLPHQCKYFEIPLQPYFRHWINVEKVFSRMMGQWPRGLKGILRHLGLPHIGRHHSGIDDCRNIANITKELANLGYRY